MRSRRPGVSGFAPAPRPGALRPRGFGSKWLRRAARPRHREEDHFTRPSIAAASCPATRARYGILPSLGRNGPPHAVAPTTPASKPFRPRRLPAPSNRSIALAPRTDAHCAMRRSREMFRCAVSEAGNGRCDGVRGWVSSERRQDAVAHPNCWSWMTLQLRGGRRPPPRVGAGAHSGGATSHRSPGAHRPRARMRRSARKSPSAPRGLGLNCGAATEMPRIPQPPGFP
jgi:hypothetical protein